MDDSKKRYTYTYPEFLNTLIMYISEQNCEFSAWLEPNIPEFIKASEPQRPRWATTGNPEKDKQQDIEHASTMFKLCIKYNIFPFLSLIFDSNNHGIPKIEYVGYHFGDYNYVEPFRTCVHPSHFSQDKKWYFVLFKDIRGTSEAKRGIADFIKQGYVVTCLEAKLNPHTETGDHYYDYKEWDASLYARKGIISVNGKVPDDFDPTTIQQKQLPEPPKLLEGIVDKLLRT
ncbi:hypothetical protein HYV49_02445 [Candidatus Pacearchaeota archaeon]|nr:hypothetical protein [Candidatus Pacearchaeota archaeon]